MKDKRLVIYAVISVVLLLSPLFLNAYWVDVLNNVGLYTILALSLNIILGHAGLFHMGHAAFYALGAYTTAIINTTYHIPILWLLPVSGLVAGLAALVVARPIIHLRGDYLLIVTIGFVEIVRIALVNNVFGITGGSNGIFGINRPILFGWKINKPWEFFYLIWGFAAVTIFLFNRLENSRFGRALNFSREDDVAAEGSGINTAHYKLIAFVIGADVARGGIQGAGSVEHAVAEGACACIRHPRCRVRSRRGADQRKSRDYYTSRHAMTSLC